MEYPIKKISLSHPNYPDLLKQIYNLQSAKRTLYPGQA